MKREFLKSLSLPDDVIDAVMAEAGKDVERLKAENESLKSAQAGVSDALGGQDPAALLDELATLKQQYAGDTKRLEDALLDAKRTAALDLELFRCGVKNPKAVKALLDLDQIALSDDGLTGLSEQLSALQKSDGYLFLQDGASAMAQGMPAPKEERFLTAARKSAGLL